jgi:cyanophycin synthetase
MDSAAHIELSRQKLTPESVPEEGREVLIQRNANHEFDVTDEVHPDTAAAASLAARIVGLDIAGVDLVVEDISKPLSEQGGAIVEVNAGPGLLMHLKPGVGKPRPVGRAIVDHLFPGTSMSRIPVIGITGSLGKTSVARLLAHLLQLSGKNVGLACSDGLFLGRRALETKDSANWPSAHRMLMARAVEAAVFENGAATILGEGLAYDRCQIGVVTNISHCEGLEAFDVRDLDTVFKALRTQIDVVLSGGASVLNAGDPRVAEMAALSDGEVLFFGIDPELPVLVEHRSKNGRCVFIRDKCVILASGSNEQQLISITALPMITPGTPEYTIENLLAGVATAWALELTPDMIRAGVATYVPTEKTSGITA